MTELYRVISAEEFARERTMQFEGDSPEMTGHRFETISHEEFEALMSQWRPDPEWQSRLGAISQIMPLDYQAYAAIVLPWTASRGDLSYEPRGLADAYRFFGLAMPGSFTLDRMYADFQVIEHNGDVPMPARSILSRFAGNTDTIFVKVQGYGSNESAYLAFERDLFLALDNPFAATPNRFGLFAVFPRGGAWYLHHPADTPILYVAGSAALIAALASVLDDRLVPLSLSDRYYS